MKLTDSLVNTVSSLSLGCIGLGFGAQALGAAGTIGLPAFLGVATAAGLWAVHNQKHGIESEPVLKSIQEKLAKDFRYKAAFTGKSINIQDACKLLDRFLKNVMLPKDELAKTAANSGGQGFPDAATEIVMTALIAKSSEVLQAPSPFADASSGEAEFARAVIRKAFQTAILEKEYWEQMKPYLDLEIGRVVGETFELVKEVDGNLKEQGKKLDIQSEQIERLPLELAKAVVQLWQQQGHQSNTLKTETILALASRLPNSGASLDEYVISLINALDEAEDLIRQGHNPGNDVDAFAAQVIRQISDKLEAGDPDGASDEAEAAFTQWEAEEKERADAAIRNGVAILKAGIRADIAASRPNAVADKEIRLIELTVPANAQVNAIRAKQDEYYERGRDKGIRIDLEIAIALARHCLARAAGPSEAGAAGNDLGIALQTLGERETGTKRLEEAVTAFRAALEEKTRDRAPLDWAATQNNLGIVLRHLGSRETGTTRLEEAVTAYRAALKEWTHDRVPLNWAKTQNNLGNALWALGERESGTKRLEEAVTAFRAALEERTRDRVPLDWAMTQNNLGSALQTLGERESGTKRLEQAVTAYQNALEEHTRDRVPLQWAMTQNNLGSALQTLGQRESGTKRLEDAVTAFQNALEEYTRDHVPLYWATTQMNLGNALQTLGQRESGAKRLEQAVTAYQNALEERTRDRVPLDWAKTQNNLGNALSKLGQRESGTKRLEDAVTAFQNALEERTRDRVPLDWATTQMNLGNALAILGERESGTERLEQAVTAYQNALKENTRDRVPLDWAATNGNLAGINYALAEKGEDPAGNLRRAIDLCNAALEVYEAAGADYYIDLFSKNRAIIQAKLAALDE